MHLRPHIAYSSLIMNNPFAPLAGSRVVVEFVSPKGIEVVRGILAVSEGRIAIGDWAIGLVNVRSVREARRKRS